VFRLSFPAIENERTKLTSNENAQAMQEQER